MSNAAIQNFLDVFDRLTADEQREAVNAILRRANDLDLPPLDVEAIDRVADESFLEYDARESARAEG